jgi:ankyrin repeat protein
VGYFNIKIVNLLLERGAPNIDTRNITRGWESTLHYAAERGTLDILDCLLRQPRFDINGYSKYENRRKKWTPLIAALSTHQWFHVVKVVEVSLRYRVRLDLPGFTANGTPELPISVAKRRASSLLREASYMSLDAKQMRSVVKLLRLPSLYAGIDLGHELLVQEALDAEADPNESFQERQALVAAIESATSEPCYVQIVDALIKSVGQVNSSFGGETLLYTACSRGLTHIAAQLLDRGALVDVGVEGGYTPLYAAIYHEYIGTAELLIERGANVKVAMEMAMKSAPRTHIKFLMWKDRTGR